LILLLHFSRMSIPPPAIKSEDIDLSKFSLENLHEMRITFPGYKDEDYARFLIARNNQLNDAKELFHNHLVWKETNPKPTKSSCLNLLQRKFLYLNGYDLEGHPLLIAKMSRHDPYDRDLDEMNRQLLWWLDHVSCLPFVSPSFLNIDPIRSWLPCLKINPSTQSSLIELVPLLLIKIWNYVKVLLLSFR
jgi:hypothetical protein